MARVSTTPLLPLLATVLLFAASGCTSVREYVQNGFKVGPNQQSPPAPISPAWIDGMNPRVKEHVL